MTTQGRNGTRTDTTDASAQLAGPLGHLAVSNAEVVRRQAIVSTLDDLETWSSAITPPALHWPNDISAAIRTTEEGIARTDILDLQANLASIESQIAQKTSDEKSVDTTITAQRDLIATLGDLATMRSTGSRRIIEYLFSPMVEVAGSPAAAPNSGDPSRAPEGLPQAKNPP